MLTQFQRIRKDDEPLLPALRQPRSGGATASFTLPFADVGGRRLVLNERAPITIRIGARALNGSTGHYRISIDERLDATMIIGEEFSCRELMWTNCVPSVVDIGMVESNTYTAISILPDSCWLRKEQSLGIFSLEIVNRLFRTATDQPDAIRIVIRRPVD